SARWSGVIWSTRWAARTNRASCRGLEDMGYSLGEALVESAQARRGGRLTGCRPPAIIWRFRHVAVYAAFVFGRQCMSFRRAIVFAAALAASAAMAQDATQQPTSSESAAGSASTAPATSAPAAAASGAATAASAPAAAASAAATAASASAAATTAAPVAAADDFGPLAGDAEAGQGKAAVCGACHGMDGNSSDPQYPKLAGQNEHYIVEQLKNFKSGS